MEYNDKIYESSGNNISTSVFIQRAEEEGQTVFIENGGFTVTHAVLRIKSMTGEIGGPIMSVYEIRTI
jgi:hypothetical protein